MDILNSLVNKVDSFRGTDLEKKVKEATSEENWGASSGLKAEIARATFDYDGFRQVMPLVWKRMQETPRNWRIVFKALVLLEDLIRLGSERVVNDARDHQYHIRSLQDFNYYDPEEQKDRGAGVREKAKQLMDLLGDNEKIAELRALAKKSIQIMNNSQGSGQHRYDQGFGSYDNYADRQERFNDRRDEEVEREKVKPVVKRVSSKKPKQVEEEEVEEEGSPKKKAPAKAGKKLGSKKPAKIAEEDEEQAAEEEEEAPKPKKKTTKIVVKMDSAKPASSTKQQKPSKLAPAADDDFEVNFDKQFEEIGSRNGHSKAAAKTQQSSLDIWDTPAPAPAKKDNGTFGSNGDWEFQSAPPPSAPKPSPVDIFSQPPTQVSHFGPTHSSGNDFDIFDQPKLAQRGPSAVNADFDLVAAVSKPTSSKPATDRPQSSNPMDDFSGFQSAASTTSAARSTENPKPAEKARPVDSCWDSGLVDLSLKEKPEPKKASNSNAHIILESRHAPGPSLPPFGAPPMGMSMGMGMGMGQPPMGMGMGMNMGMGQPPMGMGMGMGYPPAPPSYGYNGYGQPGYPPRY